MIEKRTPELSSGQVAARFDRLVSSIKLPDQHVAIEIAAQDVRVGWLVDYSHRDVVDRISGPAEYIELMAQVADSYEFGPEEMNAVIGCREDWETYEQA